MMFGFAMWVALLMAGTPVTFPSNSPDKPTTPNAKPVFKHDPDKPVKVRVTAEFQPSPDKPVHNPVQAEFWHSPD